MNVLYQLFSYEPLQAALLGIIQGLTEFLPVSSSAHLKIIPWLFDWSTPGLVFDTSLHLGSSLALLIFFRKDFTTMLLSLFAPKVLKKETAKQYKKLSLAIILSIIPVGIVGLMSDDYIEYIFGPEMLPQTIYIVSAALMLFAALLYLADKYGKCTKTTETMSFKDAFIVGLFQIFALIPGVSRSGSTIFAGMISGLTRAEAARYSFLLGTPIVILAGLFKLKDLATIAMTSDIIIYFITGVIASAFSSYLVIKFLLSYLKSKSLLVFVVYRILLGLFITGIALSGFMV